MVEEGKRKTAAVPSAETGDVRRVPVAGLRWTEAFAAFRHRNYRIFFAGQVVSLVGTWLQSTAEGWLVYELSGSSVALGAIRFAHMLPFALMALWGGLVADRRSKRAVLLGTQSAAMGLALLLAWLVFAGRVEVWHVAAIGFTLGIVNAFDVPARQAFVVELVGRDDLINGIALNSSMFNLARVVGPAVAGLLIGTVGLAGCFLLNGLSYVAVLAGYAMLRLPKFERVAERPSFRAATGEAWGYIRASVPLRSILLLVATFSVFGASFAVLMPVFAKDVLGGDAASFGTLMAFNGGGALAGGLTLASVGKRFRPRTLVFAGLFGCCGLLIGFAWMREFWAACALLFGAGFFMIVFLATANTATQLRSPDALRGRIMGFYSLSFLGMSSVGGLLAGWLAQVMGAPWAVTFGAVVCVGVALAVRRGVAARAEAAEPTPLRKRDE